MMNSHPLSHTNNNNNNTSSQLSPNNNNNTSSSTTNTKTNNPSIFFQSSLSWWKAPAARRFNNNNNNFSSYGQKNNNNNKNQLVYFCSTENDDDDKKEKDFRRISVSASFLHSKQHEILIGLNFENVNKPQQQQQQQHDDEKNNNKNNITNNKNKNITNTKTTATIQKQEQKQEQEQKNVLLTNNKSLNNFYVASCFRNNNGIFQTKSSSSNSSFVPISQDIYQLVTKLTPNENKMSKIRSVFRQVCDSTVEQRLVGVPAFKNTTTNNTVPLFFCRVFGSVLNDTFLDDDEHDDENNNNKNFSDFSSDLDICVFANNVSWNSIRDFCIGNKLAVSNNNKYNNNNNTNNLLEQQLIHKAELKWFTAEEHRFISKLLEKKEFHLEYDSISRYSININSNVNTVPTATSTAPASNSSSPPSVLSDMFRDLIQIAEETKIQNEQSGIHEAFSSSCYREISPSSCYHSPSSSSSNNSNNKNNNVEQGFSIPRIYFNRRNTRLIHNETQLKIDFLCSLQPPFALAVNIALQQKLKQNPELRCLIILLKKLMLDSRKEEVDKNNNNEKNISATETKTENENKIKVTSDIMTSHILTLCACAVFDTFDPRKKIRFYSNSSPSPSSSSEKQEQQQDDGSPTKLCVMSLFMAFLETFSVSCGCFNPQYHAVVCSVDCPTPEARLGLVTCPPMSVPCICTFVDKNAAQQLLVMKNEANSHNSINNNNWIIIENPVLPQSSSNDALTWQTNNIAKRCMNISQFGVFVDEIRNKILKHYSKTWLSVGLRWNSMMLMMSEEEEETTTLTRNTMQEVSNIVSIVRDSRFVRTNYATADYDDNDNDLSEENNDNDISVILNLRTFQKKKEHKKKEEEQQQQVQVKSEQEEKPNNNGNVCSSNPSLPSISSVQINTNNTTNNIATNNVSSTSSQQLPPAPVSTPVNAFLSSSSQCPSSASSSTVLASASTTSMNFTKLLEQNEKLQQPRKTPISVAFDPKFNASDYLLSSSSQQQKSLPSSQTNIPTPVNIINNNNNNSMSNLNSACNSTQNIPSCSQIHTNVNVNNNNVDNDENENNNNNFESECCNYYYEEDQPEEKMRSKCVSRSRSISLEAPSTVIPTNSNDVNMDANNANNPKTREHSLEKEEEEVENNNNNNNTTKKSSNNNNNNKKKNDYLKEYLPYATFLHNPENFQIEIDDEYGVAIDLNACSSSATSSSAQPNFPVLISLKNTRRKMKTQEQEKQNNNNNNFVTDFSSYSDDDEYTVVVDSEEKKFQQTLSQFQQDELFVRFSAAANCPTSAAIDAQKVTGRIFSFREIQKRISEVTSSSSRKEKEKGTFYYSSKKENNNNTNKIETENSNPYNKFASTSSAASIPVKSKTPLGNRSLNV